MRCVRSEVPFSFRLKHLFVGSVPAHGLPWWNRPFAGLIGLGPREGRRWGVACRTDQTAGDSKGRQLRFLANVDPVDVARALNGLDQETTLVVVVSKTFTTAETMLNARTVR